MSQDNKTTSINFTFDALGRRYQDKVGTTVKTVRHYLDETDNPSWVTGTGTSTAQTDLYTPSLGSSLNATRKVNGTITTTYLNVGNLHGDTITSLQLPTTGYVSGPNELNVYGEYGVQQTPELDNRPVGIGNYSDTTQLFVLTYGSLGQPQRETSATGIQFMGARGYNPITGQFLTPDPVQGGNETPYNYPNDPINKSDISGSLGLLSSVAISFVVSWVIGTAVAGVGAASVICGAVVLVGAAIATSLASEAIESSIDDWKSSSGKGDYAKAAIQGNLSAIGDETSKQVKMRTKNTETLCLELPAVRR